MPRASAHRPRYEKDVCESDNTRARIVVPLHRRPSMFVVTLTVSPINSRSNFPQRERERDSADRSFFVEEKSDSLTSIDLSAIKRANLASSSSLITVANYPRNCREEIQPSREYQICSFLGALLSSAR